MRNLLATFFLAALAGNAMAEWTAIHTSEDMIVYVDTATIRQSANTVKMWSMLDYSKPQPMEGDETFSSKSHLYEYDCPEQRMRALQVSAFRDRMLGGGLVHTAGNTPWNWQYVQPGTVAEVRLKIACKKK